MNYCGLIVYNQKADNKQTEFENKFMAMDKEKIQQLVSQLKAQAIKTRISLTIKFRDLKELWERFGFEGATHWLKSQHQVEERLKAIEKLVESSDSPNFTMLQVEKTLNSFLLPKEDSAQAEWYRVAHKYLAEFETALINKSKFDLIKLQAAQKEMRFITQTQSDKFHVYYRIEKIQQKVNEMYQTLQQAIIDYKTLERDKLKTQQELEATAASRSENEMASAEARKAELELEKIKEKRMAIMEEKKRQLAERARIEAENLQQKLAIEKNQLEDKSKRESELQNAYQELQFDEQFSNMPVDEIIKKLSKKLNSTQLSAEQRAVLSRFVNALHSQLG